MEVAITTGRVMSGACRVFLACQVMERLFVWLFVWQVVFGGYLGMLGINNGLKINLKFCL